MIWKQVGKGLLFFFIFFNRFHHEGSGHTTERGSKLSVPLREAL